MENKTFFVYLYKNPLKNNEIFYVGYGDHLRKGGGCRAYDHLNEVKRGRISKNLHKYYTIKKILDGGSSPIIEIILNNVTKKEATDLEKELRIKHKDTLTNIANGGDGGDTFTNQPLWKKNIIRKKLKNKVPTIHSEEWKSQLSEMRKKDGNPFYGKKHTDTTKEKCGSVWRGKKIPEDLINKRRTLSIYKLEFPDGTDLTFTGRVEYENFFRNYNSKKLKSEKVSWQLLLKNKTLKGFKLFIIGSIKKSDYIKKWPQKHIYL
jgi:hypothetical protein